jgi:hypothetical protein
MASSYATVLANGDWLYDRSFCDLRQVLLVKAAAKDGQCI